MKHNRIAKEIFSKITDDFLKKSINIVLNSRINRLSEKEALSDKKVFPLLNCSFSLWRTLITTLLSTLMTSIKN